MSSSSAPMQQAPQAVGQDNAMWSIYDFGDMYNNEDFMHRNAIVHCNITSISLYGSPRDKTDYTTDDWQRIGIAMGECSKLKELDLVGVKLKKAIVKNIFRNRAQHTWPDFGVIRADQGVMGLRALLPTLKSFPSWIHWIYHVVGNWVSKPQSWSEIYSMKLKYQILSLVVKETIVAIWKMTD